MNARSSLFADGGKGDTLQGRRHRASSLARTAAAGAPRTIAAHDVPGTPHRADPGTLKAGLLATFEATLPSMAQELLAMAAARGASLDLRQAFVPEAMRDLAADHHCKIADERILRA